MSVLSAYPAADQPFEGGETLSDGAERRYEITYIVNTSATSDNSLTILSSRLLPQPYSTYSYGGYRDGAAELVRRDVRQAGPRTFEVQCVWETPTAQKSENPMSKPAQRSWRTVQYETYPFYDLSGKLIRNSAGHPFDSGVPVMRHYSVYRVVRNESYLDTVSVSQYVGAVNGMPWRGVTAGCAKVLDISGDEQYDEPRRRYYVTVTYEVAVNPEGWDPWVLDQGPWCWKRYEGGTRKKYADVDEGLGVVASKTFLLNGQGFELEPEVVQQGKANYLRFQTHRRVNFAALRL